MSPIRKASRRICDEAGGLESDDIACEDFESRWVEVQYALCVVCELVKCLIALDKKAVEIVGLASVVAGNRAFVVVSGEVADGANIAFAGCCVL